MYTYKTVPAPTVLIANNDKEKANVVSMFGDLINRECAGGWEFYSLEAIAVAVNPDCLTALAGGKQSETLFNDIQSGAEKEFQASINIDPKDDGHFTVEIDEFHHK